MHPRRQLSCHVYTYYALDAGCSYHYLFAVTALEALECGCRVPGVYDGDTYSGSLER